VDSKQLQRKYSELKEKLDDLKSSKIKKETLKESLEKEKQSLEEKILKLASTKTVEEARAKLDLVESKLSELLTEAEAIING
jgi:ABC-type hemin transport system substrate-binding protein